MKIIFQLIIILFISKNISAQYNLNYTNLKCSGIIPANLLTTTKDKYELEKEVIKKSSTSKKDKKLQSKYSIEVNYLLDNLMLEGSILFNDEISNYLNTIVQNLVKNESNLIKNKIKVYTIRSTEVNAFATQRGDIFVTMGLIAKLKNESEIAFILAHEVTHFLQEHNLKMYIELNKVSKKNRKEIVLENKEEYSNANLLKKCLFSKDQESEADSLGCLRYMNAGYEIKYVQGVFDILSSSNIPLQNEPFKYEILETNTITIPLDIKLFAVPKLITEEEVNDDYSSHPNISKRRKFISNQIQTTQNVLSKTLTKEFESINNRGQLELPMLFLQSKDYINAVYTSATLLNKYPDNVYLKKCLAKSLYNIMKLKNNSISIQSNSYEYPGYSNSVYHFIDKINKNDFNYMTLQYCWNIKKNNNEDKELQQLNTEIQNEFKKYTFVENSEKYKSELSKSFPTENIDLLFNSPKNEVSLEIISNKKSKKNRKYVGIDSLIIIDAGYASIDNRKKTEFDFLNTESRKINLVSLINRVSNKSNLTTFTLDAKTIDSSEIEKFNDIVQINNWFAEQDDSVKLNRTLVSNQQEINTIIEKYGTKYVLKTGIISIRQKNNSSILIPISLIFCWPALPFTIAASIKPKYDMIYFSYLANLMTGEKKLINFNYIKHKDTDVLIKSHLYNTFLEINKKGFQTKAVNY